MKRSKRLTKQQRRAAVLDAREAAIAVRMLQADDPQFSLSSSRTGRFESSINFNAQSLPRYNDHDAKVTRSIADNLVRNLNELLLHEV